MSAVDVIKEVLPWVGTALGGPLAPMVASIASKFLNVPADSVQSTLETLVTDPQSRIQILTLENQVRVQLEQMGYTSLQQLNELIQKSAAEVNATMRAETTAEHWPQYTWRPYNGFLFGTTIFCSYFLLPLLGKPIPTIPEFVWISWGGILGLASFFRGKMQADPNIPTATKITKLSQ